jgi:hypothetical protein
MQQISKIKAAADIHFLRVVLISLLSLTLGNAVILFTLL